MYTSYSIECVCTDLHTCVAPPFTSLWPTRCSNISPGAAVPEAVRILAEHSSEWLQCVRPHRENGPEPPKACVFNAGFPLVSLSAEGGRGEGGGGGKCHRWKGLGKMPKRDAKLWGKEAVRTEYEFVSASKQASKKERKKEKHERLKSKQANNTKQRSTKKEDKQNKIQPKLCFVSFSTKMIGQEIRPERP